MEECSLAFLVGAVFSINEDKVKSFIFVTTDSVFIIAIRPYT